MKIERRKFIKESSLGILGLAVSDPFINRMFAAEIKDFKDTIPKRILGKTNLKVTIIGLGGWHIGRLKDEITAQNIISKAVDLGINFFDTAADYQKGLSEVRYGKVLKKYRKNIYIMSKAISRDNVGARKELELSLKNLQTDYLDLWQFHSIKTKEDVEKIFSKGGAYETAIKAKEEGKIRHIGITGHYNPNVNLEALRYHNFLETIQMPVNLVDPHSKSFIKMVLPKAIEYNLGIIAMKTVANGRILEYKVASVSDCLTFAWNLPVSLIVSGVDIPEQLVQNVKTAQTFKRLTEKDKLFLLNKSKGSDYRGIEYYKMKND